MCSDGDVSDRLLTGIPFTVTVVVLVVMMMMVMVPVLATNTPVGDSTFLPGAVASTSDVNGVSIIGDITGFDFLERIRLAVRAHWLFE